MNYEVLAALAGTIQSRRSADAEQSYTRKLLDRGTPQCAKKFGEEAVEVVIASLHDNDAALHAEVADLLYHLLVLLESRETDLGPVLEVLADRFGISGLDEKASRQQD